MAGDSIELSREWTGYTQALGYTLQFTVTGTGGRVDAVVVADADCWLVTVTSAATLALAPGAYSIIEAATRAPDTRVSLLNSPLFITANALDQAGTASDQREFAERMLQAVEAIMEERATSDQIDLIAAQGATTSMQRDPMALLKLRDYWTRQVQLATRRESIAAGRGNRRMIGVAFRG